MSLRSPTRLDARGVPIVFPTQSPQQSPRRRQHIPLPRSAAPAGSDMDEVKLFQVRPKVSTPSRQDRSLLDEHDEFTDACHRSHLNHINRMFYQGSPQGAISPNSWQDVSTEPLPTSARASPTSPATQLRQRRSPYGSPFQRLDIARRTRNKHPWISPTRNTTGQKRTLDKAPPLNLFNIPEPANKSPSRKGNKTSKKRKILDFHALETNIEELPWPESSTEPPLQQQFPATPPTQQSSQCQQTQQAKTYLSTPLSQPTTATTKNNVFAQSNARHHNQQYQMTSPSIDTNRKPAQSTPLSLLENDMPIDRLQLDGIQSQNRYTVNAQPDSQPIVEDDNDMQPENQPIGDNDNDDNGMQPGNQPIGGDDNDENEMQPANQLIDNDDDGDIRPDNQHVSDDGMQLDQKLLKDDMRSDNQRVVDDVKIVNDPINVTTAKAKPSMTEDNLAFGDTNYMNVQLDPLPQNETHQGSASYDYRKQTEQQPKNQDENEILHHPSRQQQQPDDEQTMQHNSQKLPLKHVTLNRPAQQQSNQVENGNKHTTSNKTVDEDKAKQDQQLVKKQMLQQEIDALTKSVKLLRTHYQLLEKIGCGTFSSVYKALDIRYDTYDNSFWDTTSPLYPLASPISENDTTGKYTGQQQPEQKRFVALKQIYATSSPKRMAQEIKILQHLRGAPCVSQLITAFRQHEYVFLVMPYFQHNNFKECYRKMTMLDTKYYLKALLTALKHLHSHRILHRDIKPNNFLYNVEMKTGMLIDFGLAQREEDTKPPEPPKSGSPVKLNMIKKPSKSTSSATPKQKQAPSASATLIASNDQPLSTPTPTSIITATSNKTMKTSVGKSTTNMEDDKLRKPGYIKHDPRKAIRANRAGTRGFRAPEVLLRVTHQTVAIDIWSVGVILLSLLTGRYPFFIAHDESDSLIEIASIFGMADMKDCAALHNRTFETNIETIPRARKSLTKLCQVMNTEKIKLWAEDDRQNVQNAIDLVEKMLALDYRKRITAEDALKHPFLSESHLHPLPSLSSSTSSYSSSSTL